MEKSSQSKRYSVEKKDDYKSNTQNLGNSLSHNVTLIIPSPPYGLSSSIQSSILFLLPLRLPPHKPATKRKERDINRRPGEKDAEIEPDAGVQVEERGTRGFDDWDWGC